MAVRITLTNEQMNVVRASKTKVDVCDPHGLVVGSVDPTITPEFIAELKRRLAIPGPRYTGEQVRARLRALEEEWDRTGGFDEAYMKKFLAQLNAADPGHICSEKGGTHGS